MTLDQTSLDDMIMDGVVDLLTTELKDAVTDKAKALTIRAGHLQDSPQDNRISILVHPGGEDWPDGLQTEDEGPALHVPNSYLLGGGHFNRMRFALEIQIAIPKASREASRKRAQLVFKRARHALVTWAVNELGADSFGEHAFPPVQVWEWHMAEGGGDGAFNWNGKILFEVQTMYDPV